MASRSAILSIEILTDATKATSGLDAAAGKVDKFRGTMSKLAGPSALALGAIGAFGKGAVDAASSVEQSMGAVDSVFGKNADQVKAWSDQAAQSVGLSKSAYGDLAAGLGAQLKNLGVPMDQVAGNTDDLIGLGSDLAATFGGSTQDAVNALGSALRGEADPAEKYGLALSQTAVNARLAEKGMDNLSGEALTAAKAQTIMELATEQSGGALGQFARESDSAAGSAQIAAAQFEDAQAALGEALLPAVTAVTSKLGEMANWVQQNSTLVLVLVGVIGGLAAAVLAINAAFAVWTAATRVAAAVNALLNSTLLANPVTWVVIAIIALVAAVVLLWQKNEGFRNFVIGAWKAIQAAAVTAWNAIKSVVLAVVSWMVTQFNKIKAVATVVWNAIKASATAVWNGIKSVVSAVVVGIINTVNNVKSVATGVWTAIKDSAVNAWNNLKDAVITALNLVLAPIRAVQSAFDKVVDVVRSIIDWVGKIKFPEPPQWMRDIGSGISNLFSAPAPSSRSAFAPSPFGVVAGGSSPTLRAATGSRGPSAAFAGQGVTVNVYGGLDSADTIARRVADVLRGRARRTGAVTIGRRDETPHGRQVPTS